MYSYYFLNIRHKEKVTQNEAAKWIDQNKKVPIFFGDTSIEDLTAEGNSQAKLFCAVGNMSKSEQKNCRIVTIDDGHVYIYRPCGKISTENAIQLSDRSVIPKAIPISLLKKIPVSETPLVLASMRVNQAVSRGTFFDFTGHKGNREGAYKGNRAAVQAVTSDWEINFKVDPLDCLSSLEFETLVAKLFEEHGCFVPAYKGGYLKDVDLFVTPNETTNFCGIKLVRKVKKSIQLKLSKPSGKEISAWLDSSKNNLFISLDDGESPDSTRVFTKQWLRQALLESSQTNEWLQQSLHWLPKRNRKKI